MSFFRPCLSVIVRVRPCGTHRAILLTFKGMADEQHTPAKAGQRRPYVSPHLVELGDLRSLTLGGSPGANDSGIGDPRRPLVIGQAPFPPSDSET